MTCHSSKHDLLQSDTEHIRIRELEQSNFLNHTYIYVIEVDLPSRVVETFFLLTFIYRIAHLGNSF